MVNGLVVFPRGVVSLVVSTSVVSCLEELICLDVNYLLSKVSLLKHTCRFAAEQIIYSAYIYTQAATQDSTTSTCVQARYNNVALIICYEFHRFVCKEIVWKCAFLVDGSV